MRASALVAAFVVVVTHCGCTTSGASGSACENPMCQGFPRMVVAQSVALDAGNEAGTQGIQVTAVIDGIVDQSGPSGCFGDVTSIDCEYQFWCGPSTTEMTLRVQVGSQPAIQRIIPMHSFNYCGNDVAYVHFTVTGDAVEIGDPQYVSPCASIQ